jgi:hypothetical protein
MDAREELKRWLAVLVQMADEAESKTIKQDVDMFLAVASELTGKLAARNSALARQIRPRSAKPPKASTQNGPQKQKTADSSTDTPKPETGAEGSSQGLSHIQQGIQQAVNSPTSLKSQGQALRQQAYGADTDEKMFRQAAKAIAS